MFATYGGGVAVTKTTNQVFQELMFRAYEVAFNESTDTNTKIGALLINAKGGILVSGANAFIDPAMTDVPANHERPRKYKLTEHAERASIYKAAMLGIPLQGQTMVCPWACCTDCARAIVLSGIKLVVAHQQAYDMTPERWQEEVSLGIEILEGGGVSYMLYDGEIGGIENLFNGKIWCP